MRIGRFLYPVKELGPGDRLGIWVQGCERACPGCANPELWALDERKDIPLDMLIKMVRSVLQIHSLDRITITGGEPFLQSNELGILLECVQDLCQDILVFTGFTYNQLQSMQCEDVNRFLSHISVLVDGPYVSEQNAGDRLRGSKNQQILFLDETRKEEYLAYMYEKDRIIDNFIAEDGVISVGIHPQAFLDQV